MHTKLGTITRYPKGTDRWNESTQLKWNESNNAWVESGNACNITSLHKVYCM